MRLLLVGNYGVGNLGDEALKEYFLTRFPEIDWIVVSANPRTGEVARLPMGIRSFFWLRWMATLRAYREADGVVFEPALSGSCMRCRLGFFKNRSSSRSKGSGLSVQKEGNGARSSSLVEHLLCRCGIPRLMIESPDGG